MSPCLSTMSREDPFATLPMQDEWKGKTNPSARRKIQNRLNQRAYRERQRAMSRSEQSVSRCQLKLTLWEWTLTNTRRQLATKAALWSVPVRRRTPLPLAACRRHHCMGLRSVGPVNLQIRRVHPTCISHAARKEARSLNRRR